MREVALKTITKTPKEGGPRALENEGAGFVLGNYLLTRDHVTSTYSIDYQTSFVKVQEVIDRKNMVSELTFLDGVALVPIIERPEDDVAIFDLSKTPKLCEKYCNNLTLDDLMTEGELYQGMRVYWVGNPLNVNGFYRESHIAKIRGKEDRGTDKEDTFIMNNEIIPGTSGKPIWHADKIVGVVHFYWNGMGGAGFMDNYIKEIKKYESLNERVQN